MRKNGWQAPMHKLQVATWIVFPVLLISFFAFVTPFLSLAASIISSVLYGLMALGIVLSVYHCTSVDPADDSILRQSQSAAPQVHTSENQVYCNVCMHYVYVLENVEFSDALSKPPCGSQDGSRHCRLCDKCIQVFDHHCKWLNNCIGQKNYVSFSVAILGTSFILSLQLSLSIYLLYKAFVDPQVIQGRGDKAFGCFERRDFHSLCSAYRFPLHATKIVHGILIGILLPLWFLICQLTCFHSMLTFRNLTTYDYIVRKRKLRLAQERETSKARWRWFGILGSCRKRAPEIKIDKDRDARMAGYSDGSASQQIDEELIEAEVDDELEVLSTRSSESRFESSVKTNVSSQMASPQKNAFPILDDTVVSKRGFGRLMDAKTIFSGSECNLKTPQQQACDSETEYVPGLDTPRARKGAPGSPHDRGLVQK